MRPAVSLKWKTMALLGLALMLVNLGVLLDNHRSGLRDAAASQQRELQQQLQILERLLGRAYLRLRRIGNIVPSVVDALALEQDLQERWITLQLELDLKALMLLDRQGRPLLHGLSAFAGGLPPQIQTRISQALRDERPDQFLYCDDSCAHYALVPSLGPGGESRLMVIGAALTDLILEFPSLTQADLAVFAPGAHGRLAWGETRLFAVSDAPVNEARLRILAERHAPEAMLAGRSLDMDGRSYRFTARPWQAFGGIGPGYLLIFEDQTQALQDVAAQTRQSLISGLLAMLIAIVLSISILNRPMNQLRRLADALPLLADKAYARARELIGEDYRRRRLPTEIDVLEGLTVDLAERLEELEHQVENRNQAIAEKVSELRRSQELNEKILATAPIVIMMQTGAGRIVQVNDFACALLGYGQVEFDEMPFLELLADPRQSRETGNALVDLIAGRRTLHEQSGPVRCVDGALERITWLHTRVMARGGVYVLSLGLPDKAGAQQGQPEAVPAS